MLHVGRLPVLPTKMHMSSTRSFLPDQRLDFIAGHSVAQDPSRSGSLRHGSNAGTAWRVVGAVATKMLHCRAGSMF
jgi:hypothetical protein